MFLSPQAQYNAWDSKDGTTLWPDGGPGAANCSQEWMAMLVQPVHRISLLLAMCHLSKKRETGR